MLANTADSLIATLGGVMRILYLRPLAKYIPSSSTPKSSPNVQEIVRNNGDFKATCFAINAKVESDFKKAQEYVDAAFDKSGPSTSTRGAGTSTRTSARRTPSRR